MYVRSCPIDIGFKQLSSFRFCGGGVCRPKPGPTGSNGAGAVDNVIQVPPDRAAGLTSLLRELQTRASLLMVTAHPDDEDGGMLTYESRGQGAGSSL